LIRKPIAMNTENVVIHVRFAPNGSVTEIGERPEALAAQAWFDLLSNRAGGSYQGLSGGRALFRLPREALDALKLAAVS
jgi:hypothetical protein